MKTHQEILTEARRLEETGWREWTAHRTGAAGGVSPRLMALPESRLLVEQLGSDPVHTHVRQRWIGTSSEDSAPLYLLYEQEVVTAGDGSVVRQIEPFVAALGGAYDVLREGYEMAEEERLGELLTPFTDRIEEEGFVDSIDPSLIEEIESILEVDLLSPAARIRTRAEIVEFLEGSFKPSDFITAMVNRQCCREGEQQLVVQNHSEQMRFE